MTCPQSPFPARECRESREADAASPTLVGKAKLDNQGGGHSPPCPKPPAQIEGFVQVLGIDLTAQFLLHFGGAELIISENPRDSSQLSTLVGQEKARALGQLLRIPRRIPLSKPWLAGYFRSQGYSLADVARKLHVSDVTVRRYFKDAEERAVRLARPGPR